MRYRPKTEVVCKNCGRKFMAQINQIKAGKGKCCSRGCAAALASINRNSKGSANNNWKGGDERKKLPGYQTYRQKYPEKYEALKALTNAIRRGDITPQPCEICKGMPTEGHHDDYSKVLEVRWLCKRHHLDEGVKSRYLKSNSSRLEGQAEGTG